MLLDEKALEEMLQKLDALIMEESQMMVVQTLEVVSGLVTQTRAVVDGVHRLFTWPRECHLTSFSLDLNYSRDDIRQVQSASV